LKKKHTVHTIAKLAGVSHITVSRALNPEKSGLLRPVTYHKVMDVVKRENFILNTTARNLKVGRRNTIGFVVPFFEKIFMGDFYPRIMQGIFDVLFETQFDFRFIPCRPEKEGKNFVQFIQENQVGGLLLNAWTNYLDAFKALKSLPVPFVLINDKVEKYPYPCVYDMGQEGGYLATRHLLDLGHKKIGILQGNPNYFSSRERLKGFYSGMREFNIPVKERFILVGDYNEMIAYKTCSNILKNKNRPTALFCFNDEMALGAIRAALELGLECPKDISIIGYDDSRVAEISAPKLSTIKMLTEDLGSIGAQMLLDIIQGTPGPRKRGLPPQLIVRESTAPLH